MKMDMHTSNLRITVLSYFIKQPALKTDLGLIKEYFYRHIVNDSVTELVS